MLQFLQTLSINSYRTAKRKTINLGIDNFFNDHFKTLDKSAVYHYYLRDIAAP